jgi:ribA/ribD-fused uncharacterized protein
MKRLRTRTRRLLDSILYEDSDTKADKSATLGRAKEDRRSTGIDADPDIHDIGRCDNSGIDISFVPETQLSQSANPFNVSLSEDELSDSSSDGISEPSDEESVPSSMVPQVHTVPLPVGSPIETIITQRQPAAPADESLHLFRGPRNPLSAFYSHPLRWNGMNFASAEQAYQFQKLLFHNVSRAGRSQLMRCRSSHDVKRMANKFVPSPTTSWDNVKFSIMEDICTVKFQQCRAFKDALLRTGTSRLVHNTETDNVWGCGMDFKGTNMMGNILMDVRQKAHSYNNEFPPLPTSTTTHASTMKSTASRINPVTPNPTKSVLVFGNSNVRGLASEINARGIDCTGYVYPGQTAARLKHRVKNVRQIIPPSAVFCHAGDIEIRDNTCSVSSVVKDILNLAQELRTHFPTSRIILSSMPHIRSHGNMEANIRISQLNACLSSFCMANENYVCISHDKSKLVDGIHLSRQSKDYVARTITGFVKQCL